MRILHVTESLGRGGTERQIGELLSGLLPHRDIKSFVAVMSEEDFRYEIDSERVRIIPVVRKSGRDWRPFKSLYDLASTLKIDIVSLLGLDVLRLCSSGCETVRRCFRQWPCARRAAAYDAAE